MPRYEVFANPGAGAPDVPFLVDVQGDVLDDLQSRVVIPLRRKDRLPVTIGGPLMPTLTVAGIDCVLETPKLAALPRRVLKVPVASLAAHRDEITRALDFLFHGF